MDDATNTFSTRDAVEQLAALAPIHRALGRRTTGVTWMVWALAGTAIFLTYDALAFSGVLDGPYAFLAAVAWIPWVAAGSIISGFLWHSVGAVAPRLRRLSKVDAIGIAVFSVGMPIVLFALIASGVPVAPPAIALMILGAAFGVTASVGGLTSCRADRLAVGSAGALYIVVAVAGSIATGGATDAANQLFSVLAPATTLIVGMALGMYMVLAA